MKYLFLTTITTIVLAITFTSCETEEEYSIETEIVTDENIRAQEKDLSATGYVNFADSATLTSFWMREDHEPWNRGAAEVYAFVIGLDREKDPIIKKVNMSYADHDKIVYYPDQELINWSNFYYDTVSIIFIEADDTHNSLWTTENPNWQYPFPDGVFRNLPVEFALKYVVENFAQIGEIDAADDWIDIFENISRYRDYDVVGGILDDVYITLERTY